MADLWDQELDAIALPKSPNDSLKLVYYEVTEDVGAAITREKQIKGWLRRKKVALIEELNPYWMDLAEGWDRNPTTPQTLRFAQSL
jgi:putative endonuclease